jgi:DNA-binding NarL/FixJ family response regulator
MKIILADDKKEVRSALMLLLEHDQDSWTVEGEASHFDEICDLLDSQWFDVILLDWELPGFHPHQNRENSKSLIHLERLRTLQPEIKIIAMSGRSEARSEAVEAGVDAFVSKGDPPEVLLHTLKSFNRNTVISEGEID